MSIKQINAAYLVNEDRILLRFNTPEEAEYRFWITRRIGLFMLAATTHLLTKQLEQKHTPDTAKAIDAFEKEALVDASKITDSTAAEYQSGIHFPLGAEPILVMDVSCSLLQNNATEASKESAIADGNNEIISIDFALPGGANLSLKLASAMARAITLLLDQLRQQAGWGEVALIGSGSENVATSAHGHASLKTPIH